MCNGLAPYCGDAVISASELCDDGESNSDAYASGPSMFNLKAVMHFEIIAATESSRRKSCVMKAQLQTLRPGAQRLVRRLGTCGDGIVQAAFESCDGGPNPSNTCLYGEINCTVCSTGCSEVAGLTSYCGDGILDVKASGEACDDGNLDSTDGCTRHCSDSSQCGDSPISVATQTGECSEGCPELGSGRQPPTLSTASNGKFCSPFNVHFQCRYPYLVC